MKIAIISAGLQSTSRSRIMARAAWEDMQQRNTAAMFIDMRDYTLPLCDAEEASMAHPNVEKLKKMLADVRGFVLATPVYNYGPNSALKNLIELAGSVFTEKAVGFLCAAGGQRSYMSIMATANSLMLDFRSVIVPRFVYAVSADFINDEAVDDAIRARIAAQNSMVLKLAEALKNY